MTEDWPSWRDDRKSKIALVWLDPLPVEVDPDLIAHVASDLVVEDLRVDTQRCPGKRQVAVVDAEEERAPRLL